MTKLTLIALAALATAQVATAQTATYQSYGVDSVATTEVRTSDSRIVETNLFRHNWFVGFGLGGQVYFGDHDRQMKFLDRVGSMADIYVGKWFTPGIGVRLGVSGGTAKGVSGWTGHTLLYPNANWANYQGFIKDYTPTPAIGGFTADPYEAATHPGYTLYETRMSYIQARADVMFNLSHMIGGYEPERFYSFIPYASLGFAHTLDKAPRSGQYSHEMTGGIGLLNRFRLSNRLDINLDVRATYTGDHFDQEDVNFTEGSLYNLTSSAKRYGEGVISATVGLSYNLGKTTWDRSTVTTVRVNENVLADLRSRVGQLQATNDDLRRQLENALNREVTKENVAAQPLLVTFPIDRWVLSNKDRVNLGFLAEAIKANPNMVYSVTGYADRGTGSTKRNIFLARKRSEVIYDCLVKEFGVSESQLRRDDKGGVANMYYNDPRCSRAVLVQVTE